MKYFVIVIFVSFFVFSLYSVSAQSPPVPPSPVPPNASLVTATVLEYAVWPSGSLKNTMSPGLSDEIGYSVKVKIHTSNPVSSELEYFAVPGTTYEAFSADAIAPDLVGKEIDATLELTGTTYNVRWLISNIRLGGDSQ